MQNIKALLNTWCLVQEGISHFCARDCVQRKGKFNAECHRNKKIKACDAVEYECIYMSVWHLA